jgi:hypothetical protein
MDLDPYSPEDPTKPILRRLIAQLIDPDPCRYDHHGYCQAHSLHSAPCPHEQAKALGIEPE